MRIKTIDRHFYYVLGEKMRSRRQELGYSLEQVARKVGVTRQCYDYYELGIVKIKPETWDKICEVLKIYSGIDIQVKIGL